MLDYAWVIPLIPFASFWIILFFGKRAGTRFTSGLGILAVGAAFVLSCVVGVQWIERAENAYEGETEPVEITTNGDTYECEGIVVTHEEDAGEEEHAEAEGEEPEEVIEAETGEPVETEAEAHDEETTGLPPCDTVELQTLLSTTAAGGPGAGEEPDDEGDEPLIESPGVDIDDGNGEQSRGAQATLVGLVGPSVGDGGERAADEVAAEEDGGEDHESGAAGPVITRWTWFTVGGTEFYIGSMIDGLAVMMLFVVSTISLLVHIYSTEYLKGDRRYTHYFAFLSLFTASMLFYVIGENILQMLVGWELVGVCSFVLIGHWWEEKANSDAAVKAMLTNRVGDVGLIIGVIVLFWATGGQSFSVLGINELAATGEIRHLLLLVAALCLFAGVTSKSGQFPLHTWLPDAMAGPTPVSALIHAATMVVAGVYLIARLYPVFYEGLSISTGTINYVAFIGGLTTIVGGALAFVQRDIKKVLAYSTISQLGYMVMALGVGAWTAAVFHIFTHAFFKASLFLGAGSVSHACHHSFDMKADMGGLRKYMPQTFWTFAISSAALAGIFPLAGFWSKDEILAGAANGQEGGAYTFMLIMGLVTALLTAAYMTRTVWLTFFGEYRGHGTPHESPRTITVPLWILTGVAAVAGLLNLPGDFGIGPETPETLAHKFETWVEPTVAFAPVVHADFMIPLALGSLALALAGFGLSYAYYVKGNFNGLTQRSTVLAKGYTFLENKLYLDWLYTDVIVASIKGPIAQATNWFNQNVLDGVVDGAGKVSVATGRWLYRNVDQRAIDGAVDGSGIASDEAAGEVRKLWLSGRVQQYGAWLFGGAVVLAAALVVFV